MAPVATEYRPFPDQAGRNKRQAGLEVPALVRTMRLPRGGQVLEVGCGRGVALPALAQLLTPDRLVGLDVNPALLAEAALAAHGGAELVCADVRAMSFPDGSFDLVIDFGTLFHIARPADALREIARVLRSGGLLVHETRASQLLSHPVRARRHRIPWAATPSLQRHRRAGLWASRRRTTAS